MDKLGPNARQTCPSYGRRIYHGAHGEDCATCWPPDGRYPPQPAREQPAR